MRGKSPSSSLEAVFRLIGRNSLARRDSFSLSERASPVILSISTFDEIGRALMICSAIVVVTPGRAVGSLFFARFGFATLALEPTWAKPMWQKLKHTSVVITLAMRIVVSYLRIRKFLGNVETVNGIGLPLFYLGPFSGSVGDTFPETYFTASSLM